MTAKGGPDPNAPQDCGSILPAIPLMVGNRLWPGRPGWQPPPTPLTLGQPDQGCG